MAALVWGEVHPGNLQRAGEATVATLVLISVTLSWVSSGPKHSVYAAYVGVSASRFSRYDENFLVVRCAVKLDTVSSNLVVLVILARDDTYG